MISYAPREGPAPAFSVVLPTYQRKELVRRAAESVLGQTFGDFELIVVDDGSTDGTEETLRDTDPRLHYHRQENLGVSAARNAGIRRARAPVVAFLDSDDRWLPEHLDVVAAALERHPEAAVVSTCPRARPPGGEESAVVDLLPRLLLGNMLLVQCVAVRRGALLDIEGFDERLPVGEDADLLRRLAIRHRFCLAPARTLERNRSPDSISVEGVRNGAYLHANRLSLEACLTLIPQARPDDGPELVGRARGRLRLLEGLAALRDGDEATARGALREALTLAPAFAETPVAVRGAIGLIAPDGRTRRSYLAFVVGAWRGHPAFTDRALG